MRHPQGMADMAERKLAPHFALTQSTHPYEEMLNQAQGESGCRAVVRAMQGCYGATLHMAHTYVIWLTCVQSLRPGVQALLNVCPKQCSRQVSQN